MSCQKYSGQHMPSGMFCMFSLSYNDGVLYLILSFLTNCLYLRWAKLIFSLLIKCSNDCATETHFWECKPFENVVLCYIHNWPRFSGTIIPWEEISFSLPISHISTSQNYFSLPLFHLLPPSLLLVLSSLLFLQ